MHARLIALPFVLLTLALPIAAQAAPAAAPEVHGRVEELPGGLKLLRVWGTPAERGEAHGYLLGPEIAAAMITEFTARFSRRRPLLELARSSLGRLLVYPEDVRTELEGVFAGMLARGVDRSMPALEREFDLDDLLVANALDVFGGLACSGFTVWGDRVLGGGVLTGRNFDWPLTGRHLLENTILLVQHRPGARTTVSVTWPGYVGTVTGINDAGVAAFLHVGSGKITVTPEPESWPTATAARCVLEQLGAQGDLDQRLAKARELLSYTSPPPSYLTRVILPSAAKGRTPVAVFETDAKQCVLAPADGEFSVVTNHFHRRDDGRGISRDSLKREEQICSGVEGFFTEGDEKVSVEEAWRLLTLVERGGRRFGTLHSLVFRHDPWCFELRLAEVNDGRIVAATSGGRRFVLTREQVFGKGVPGGK